MPSDANRSALKAVAGARAAFHSAVATAVDQVQTYLSAHRSPVNGRSERAAVELGQFAAGRIDPDRFSSFFADGEEPDAETLARVEAAADVLAGISKDADDLYSVEVPSGGDLRDTVATALAEAGRAFGAARVVDLARTGRYDAATHDEFLATFPPRMWNRAERQIAPPLVVTVDGSDLRVGGLAEFLDGAQKIVLVARGDAPPAALVRLVTPGVFVMQTADAADLARIAGVDGPAVAAIVPERAARFTHDPAAGATPAARLSVAALPEEAPRKPLGRLTIFQQSEELMQLRALAAATAAAEGEEGPEPAADTAKLPGDKLAAWLLRQANLD